MEKELKKIIEKIDFLGERISKIEKIIEDKSIESIKPEKQKTLFPKEFLLTKKAADDVKKTLVLGYYLEKFENMSPFNINELEDAFVRAKEKKPINMNDKVNMNIKNGHMGESLEKKNNRKAWYLTNSGEVFVEETLKL